MDFSNFKFSIANQGEIKDRKRQTASILVMGDPRQNKQGSNHISKELLNYLVFIYETPGMSSSQRDKDYGISGAKGTRLRKQLVKLGLIEESKIKQGRGRPISDIRLTKDGENKLKTIRK